MNKKSNILSRIGAAVLAVATALTPMAAFGAESDIIDTTQKGTINLYKYDLTAATEDGIDVTQWSADGKAHSDIETAMERYKIEGVEFTYAKVADINTVSENGRIELQYNIPRELATALGLSDKTMYNSSEINQALNNVLTTDPTAGRNTLEDYMRGVGNRQTMITDADGFASATNLDLGLYFFVETRVPANVSTTIEPFFVQVPMTTVDGDEWFYEVTAYPKNQTDIPDLDKLVRQHDDAALYNKPEYGDTATGSGGDVMDYIFVSHLPKIDSESTYLKQFTFDDKMDKGLSYNRDEGVNIYFYNTKADAEANDTSKAILTWAWEGGRNENFKVTYEGSTSEFNRMIVKPTDKGLAAIDPSLSQKWIVVSYSATVNSDTTMVLGDKGNVNDVELTWRRTNMDYEDILKDRCRVFTFGLNLTKEFKASDKTPDATKVQFVLKNLTDGHYVVAKKTSEGVYYVTDATKGATENAGTKFSPAADGSLIINDLEADEYELTEIKTSDGYSLLKSPINVNIICTSDTITATKTTLYDTFDKLNNPNKNIIDVRNNTASATVDGSATVMSVDHPRNNITSTNARVDITVVNNPSFKLPMTGGTGTILFTLGGCALVFGGIVLLTRKSKKADVQ